MSWNSTGTQSGTDTNISGITAVTGVSVNVSPNGHKTYQVPTTIGLLTITGSLSWDSDYETLECSESTRIEVNAGASVTIGKSTTINGKVRWSRGTALIMNRQQSTPFINTNTVNIWVKSSTSLALGGKFIINGSRVISGGGIFCGNSTTPTNNFVTFEMNGGAVLQNIHNSWAMQMVRCFCEPIGINLNSGRIDGRLLGGLPFSNAGWNNLSVSLEYGNFQCDGNGAVEPVVVPNAELINNVNINDYSYVANANNLERINKYIFRNSDVGSALRTLGQTSTTWRIGLVELTKELKFRIVDTAGFNTENSIVFIKFLGASLNPIAGSRYFGIDDYVTPKKHFQLTDTNGETDSFQVLYAVAQGYATDNTNAGQPLTMDRLTTDPNDVQECFIWNYTKLLGQPKIKMRGTDILTTEWTLFEDVNVSLSQIDATNLISSKIEINTATKNIKVIGNGDLDTILYDIVKAWKLQNETNIEVPSIDKLLVVANGTKLEVATDWNLEISTGVELTKGNKFKEVVLQGNGLVTNNGSIDFPFSDALGSRVLVSGLNPENFDVTWFIRYRKTGDTTWNELSGTGNTTTIIVDLDEYELHSRVAGYNWKNIIFDTNNSLSVALDLQFHVSANNTPQYTMSFDEDLESKINFDSSVNSVSVENETGAIIQPGFAELYRATQRIQHLPALVWSWTAPITANSTSQKILIPTGNPVTFFLTAESNASVKVTCPVIHAESGESADDRVRGNADGFSIILGSPATAESAGLQSAIVSDILAKLGGAGYSIENDNLHKINRNVENTNNNVVNFHEELIELIGTPLQTEDYTAPDNASIEQILSKVGTLENTNLTGIATTENVTNSKTEILEAISEIPTTDVSALALESSLQSVKSKVDDLENYNDTTAQTKLDAIKAKTDILANTDLTGIEEDLGIINVGVQKASLSIPHTENV